MTVPLHLTPAEQAMAAGRDGPAVEFAMRVVLALARARGAEQLVEITAAHIDSCLYHGPVGLDFVRRLATLGARVRVPTTLNVGAVDLLHPDLVQADPRWPGPPGSGRELMTAYSALGARPTFTCAPYHHDARPGFGQHVAWAESNAIVFANTVLGARTDGYGDFLDVCAAVTGRAPYAGLHRDQARRATMILDCTGLRGRMSPDSLFAVGLGAHLGRLAGGSVAALVGLPSDLPEDLLKAIGAAAASTGSVGLFHVVGRTPEAPTLDAVIDGADVPVLTVTDKDLGRELDLLSTAPDGPIDAVVVGTPHASLAELGELARLAGAGDPVATDVAAVVNTSRAAAALAEEAGLLDVLTGAGWTVLTDTCAYLAPVLPPSARTIATNSGKVAAYAPANLGVAVVLTTTQGCVEAARTGMARRGR